MPRLPRIVIPGVPHHVTQRGNRRQRTFFSENDYRVYLDLMGQSCRNFGVQIWSYCLMPNHIHLIAVPDDEVALTRAIGSGHEVYTKYLNFQRGWRGYLWQGRFSSFPMDERHLLLAARYIEMNPVRAGIVEEPVGYPWSSARAHLGLNDDPFVDCEALLEWMPGWAEFLKDGASDENLEIFEQHERTGRPLGSEGFIRGLEAKTGLCLLPKPRGRKPREAKLGPVVCP
jgi:putative transposase